MSERTGRALFGSEFSPCLLLCILTLSLLTSLRGSGRAPSRRHLDGERREGAPRARAGAGMASHFSPVEHTPLWTRLTCRQRVTRAQRHPPLRGTAAGSGPSRELGRGDRQLLSVTEPFLGKQNSPFKT